MAKIEMKKRAAPAELFLHGVPQAGHDPRQDHGDDGLDFH